MTSVLDTLDRRALKLTSLLRCQCERSPGKFRPLLFVAALLVLLAAHTVTRAATVPTASTETPVASGLASPSAMAFAPDGRLFVCEQGGALRVIENGVLLLTPFVRPFKWSRILLTYVVPLVPLIVVFDGTMSFLRLYLEHELREPALRVLIKRP